MFSSVQSLSRVQLFATPWIAAPHTSLSITNSWSSLKLMSIESVMPSSYLIICRPFSSCLQSFPEAGSFPMSQFFTSDGQSIGVSALASVLPMNIQENFKHYFANKDLSSQGYDFSSSHVWMWELDCKESWALKNGCFLTVVLKKTLESPLDLGPVHPKGDQS